MVGGRDGLAGAPDGQAARAKAGKGLRAGDLVDEVEVDGQDARSAGLLGDEVVVPDLVDERPASGRGSGRHRWRSVLIAVDGLTEATG
jgi:hypothetical protein